MREHDKYFSADQDPYRNPQTHTLKNIPDLQTASQLKAFEEVIFQANFQEATDNITSRKLIDLSGWMAVHHICFSEVYEWAGQLRTIRIAKGNTVFSYPENIEQEANKLFKKLNELLHSNQLTSALAAEYFAEINILHPFREGNGRTQRILFTEVYRRIGYWVNYDLTDQEEMIKAMIAGYNGDYDPVKGLFERITKPIKSFD
tara:strand:+ start:2512 stop:3120 length:609 start_codon:yes stop_codon:yes gene_type:complete